jgi:hypothetical protein
MIFSLLAIALWLPVTLHCELEAIPGFEFLACVTNQEADSAKSHCEDSCCSVERAAYKIDQVRQTLPMPELLPVVLATLLNAEVVLSGRNFPEPLVSAPPDLPRTWQFVSRAAVPPRAPSFAS